MPASTRLDQNLLKKIADQTGKSVQYIREQISKRANRIGISSEAAQILWARELEIGTAHALRRLPPHLQEEVRLALPLSLPRAQPSRTASKAKAQNRSKADPIGLLLDYLLTDKELISRCKDLLRQRRHQDRVFREATVVLEDRIKQMSGITGRLNPAPLVSRALNPDPSKAILVISDEPSEQLGFHNICLGIVLAYRNVAHHSLDDDVLREDALKFCAFIDILLERIGSAKKRIQ